MLREALRHPVPIERRRCLLALTFSIVLETGDAMARKLASELIGTALLVFFGVGVATLSFGFGTIGASFAAGVVATALAFGLVLLALAYVLGPVSGCHVNPAVTIGFLAARRISVTEAVGYW